MKTYEKTDDDFFKYWKARDVQSCMPRMEAQAAWHAAAEKYAPKWVSVYERLPEKGKQVICWNWDDEIFASRVQERCTRRPTDYMIAEPNLSLPDGVTHWLDNTPLLPKEDE